MKKRIFFNKTEDMIYISHLDMIRYFERLIKMTGLKMKFSQGFNPRPKLSFGQAISLGMVAYNEPMDIELDEEVESEKLLKLLQEKSVPGFAITKVEDIEKTDSIAKDYTCVKYSLDFENKDILAKFVEIVEQDEIIVIKEKKGKTIERDLKPKIKQMELQEDKVILLLESISPNVIIRKLSEEEQETITIERLEYIV